MDIGESIKGIASALFFGLVLYGGFWIKKVFDQKDKNAINEIDLSARKISLENSTKPLDNLVSDNNKKHGVEMVGQTGNDDKKK